MKAPKKEDKDDDQDAIAKQRNIAIEILVRAALWGRTSVVDVVEYEEKNAVPNDTKELGAKDADIPASSPEVELKGATADFPILCKSCHEQIATSPEVKIVSQPTQMSSKRVRWFENRQEPGETLDYHIDFFERTRTVHLRKIKETHPLKTVDQFTFRFTHNLEDIIILTPYGLARLYKDKKTYSNAVSKLCLFKASIYTPS